MSHWLDDAARGLADGRYSRRQVLRRGGTVAGSLVMASVSGSLGGLVLPAVASGAVTCAGRHAPCKAGERCCVGVDVEEVCYHPSIDQCCEENGVKKGVCSRKKECCGHECCDPDNETCCGGRCVSKSSDVVCCRKDAHDPGEACHEGRARTGYRWRSVATSQGPAMTRVSRSAVARAWARRKAKSAVSREGCRTALPRANAAPKESTASHAPATSPRTCAVPKTSTAAVEPAAGHKTATTECVARWHAPMIRHTAARRASSAASSLGSQETVATTTTATMRAVHAAAAQTPTSPSAYTAPRPKPVSSVTTCVAVAER